MKRMYYTRTDNVCVWACMIYLLVYHQILSISEALPINKRETIKFVNDNYQKQAEKCPHISLNELITSSPVIIKALGAHIFANDNNDNLSLLKKWQNIQIPMKPSTIINKLKDSINHIKEKIKKHEDITALDKLIMLIKRRITSVKLTKRKIIPIKNTTFMSISLSSISKLTSNVTTTWPLKHNDDKTTTTTIQTKTSTNRNNMKNSSALQTESFQSTINNNNDDSNDNDNSIGNKIAKMLSFLNADAILITLIPETIYKGASLLKLTTRTEHVTYHDDFFTNDDTSKINNNRKNDSSTESSYLYDGRQLNATLEPLSCFDTNLLKLLPSELIVFGKLVAIKQQQQQQQQQPLEHQQPVDSLKISVNGLHRWNAQLEDYIWKHMGWDDWSDFTVCSVTCGQGVQQRFRRCFLDNPMINFHTFHTANNNYFEYNNNYNDNEQFSIVHNDVNNQQTIINNDNDNQAIVHNITIITNSSINSNGRNQNIIKLNDFINFNGIKVEQPTYLISKQQENIFKNNNHDNENNQTTGIHSNIIHEILLNKFENFYNNYYNNNSNNINNNYNNNNNQQLLNKNEISDKKNLLKYSAKHQNIQEHSRFKNKIKKTYSTTIFCEGYNVEQRNCNMFECSDDINDLLKFYRQLYVNDDIIKTTTTTTTNRITNTMIMAGNEMKLSVMDEMRGKIVDLDQMNKTDMNDVNVNPFRTITMNDNKLIRTKTKVNNIITPSTINLAYVNNWPNVLNFTFMLTLRVKNESFIDDVRHHQRLGGSTIVSIRNSSHNLYLEACMDGLRFYLERDKATEMLPIKFNLYDYRWHQIAISIQNGDFISVFVDCSWTNSFIVSKRLFSLPISADIEIGRGFTGDLQQLLVLPGHHERFQCSNKRTSINEVKRYIIDTFIDD